MMVRLRDLQPFSKLFEEIHLVRALGIFVFPSYAKDEEVKVEIAMPVRVLIAAGQIQKLSFI